MFIVSLRWLVLCYSMSVIHWNLVCHSHSTKDQTIRLYLHTTNLPSTKRFSSTTVTQNEDSFHVVEILLAYTFDTHTSCSCSWEYCLARATIILPTRCARAPKSALT
ncbi:hypothetical protein C8R42DRAFT_684434 [Lentinula raphanica]|nr:hypothetical protein C8R42DRAFT_684434 [Lentinula raphanica]